MIKINGNYLSVNGVQVKLSFALMALFKKLKKANGNVVKDTDLMQYAGICSRMSLTQSISLLRKKLRKFDGVAIVTHPKAGYSLKVSEVDQVNEWANGDKCSISEYGSNWQFGCDVPSSENCVVFRYAGRSHMVIPKCRLARE